MLPPALLTSTSSDAAERRADRVRDRCRSAGAVTSARMPAAFFPCARLPFARPRGRPLRLVARDDEHLRAQFQELLRHRAPDPFRPARDQRLAACQRPALRLNLSWRRTQNTPYNRGPRTRFPGFFSAAVLSDIPKSAAIGANLIVESAWTNLFNRTPHPPTPSPQIPWTPLPVVIC